MKEWLETYVKAMVSEPDAVAVSEEEGISVRVYSVTVSDADKELLAGRTNRLTRALNTALQLAGARTRKRHVLKVAG